MDMIADITRAEARNLVSSGLSLRKLPTQGEVTAWLERHDPLTQEDVRRLMAMKELRDPGDRRHGTNYAYQLGCRCFHCRKARQTTMQGYRQRSAR